MKQLFFIGVLAAFFASSTSCANTSGPEKKTTGDETGNTSKVIYLTKETFKTEIFNFETEKEWKFNGKAPAILDFYADWCGPCKMLSPLLEELQADYGGKIQVYKINTDKEKELAATFGIQSLPTVVFIPMGEKPQAIMGFRPKAELEKMISEVLKVQK